MSGAITKLPRLLTPREVSDATGVQLWRLYDLLKRGEGPAFIRIGKTYRLSESAVIEWIEQQARHVAKRY